MDIYISLCNNYKSFIFFFSPRFELPVSTDYPDIMMKKVICHRCFQPGHKISTCPLNTQPEILRPPVITHSDLYSNVLYVSVSSFHVHAMAWCY
jgi:hypothetical protein